MAGSPRMRGKRPSYPIEAYREHRSLSDLHEQTAYLPSFAVTKPLTRCVHRDKSASKTGSLRNLGFQKNFTSVFAGECKMIRHVPVC
jgi:hypothetical protein